MFKELSNNEYVELLIKDKLRIIRSHEDKIRVELYHIDNRKKEIERLKGELLKNNKNQEPIKKYEELESEYDDNQEPEYYKDDQD